ncbi:MAG: hypothetical protein JWM43_3756 [Acidobacteriaceae bacterium]|nr:hypothetical protein [Acidobacteriaceae bacterium]
MAAVIEISIGGTPVFAIAFHKVRLPFLFGLFSLVLTFNLSVSAGAQVSTGTVSGAITDSSQAALPGALVKITNLDTNQTFVSTTNGQGFYSFPGLQPAHYRVEATLPHFDRSQTTFALAVAQLAQVDLQLRVGSESTVVTVNADQAVALQTEESGNGTVISQTELQEFPIDGGNSFSLAALVPGVQPGGGFGIALSTDRGAVQTAGNANFTTNGGTAGSNEILIDGVPVTVCCQGQPALTPVPDIVSEFKVQTSVSQAQYGRSSGGVLNFVTKSGTSNIHGTLYEYFKNDKLNAANYFVKAVGTPPINGRTDYRLPLRYNQFGGSIGGPVVVPHLYDGHKRTFFFGAFSGTQVRSTNPTIGTVPTTLMRSGNFSEGYAAYGAEIYDPGTYSTTTKARSAFANHTIPASQINSVARNLLNYYPLPNIPGAGAAALTNNFQRLQNIQRSDWQYNGRLDHQFTDNSRTFVRGTLSKNSDLNPDLFNKLDGPNATNQVLQANVATLDHIWVLNSNNVLNFQYGFAYQSNRQTLQSFNIDPSTLGFAQTFIAQQQKAGVPRQVITGYTNIGAVGNTDLVHYTHVGGVSLTSQRGPHSLILGVDARLILENSGSLDSPMGTFSYTGSFTNKTPNTTIPGAQSQFLSLASYMLGYPTSGSIVQNARFSYRQRYVGLYLQDNWRASPKLTVNLGVRYDIETGPYENHNKIATISSTLPTSLGVVNGNAVTGGLAFGGINGNPRAAWATNFAQFSPRLGVNYRFQPSSVFSAAYGIMYLPVSQRIYSVGNPGSTAQTTYTATTDSIHPANSLTNPFPSGVVALPTPEQAATAALGSAIAGPVYDNRSAYIQQWNAGIQQLLTAKTTFQVNYAGSHGVKLSANLAPNDLDPKYFGAVGDTAAVTALQKTVTNPFYGKIPANSGTLGAATIQTYRLLLAFPQFTTVSQNHVNIGSGTYNSLQTSLRYASSHGTVFSMGYTWSKALGDVGNLTTGFLDTGTQTYQNSYARSNERSYSPTDAPHRVVVSVVGKLPFGHGQMLLRNLRPWQEVFLGGWTGTSIVTFQSGLPLGLTETGQASFSGSRPSFVEGQSPLTEGSTKSRLGGSFANKNYFNSSAFRVTRAFELGNVPRYCGSCRAPGSQNVDVSLNKRFQVMRRGTDLQIRIDAFNLLNRAQFGRPNTIFGTAAFGTITSQANNPRTLQLGAKLFY